jgi:hypothetical protein
MHYLDCCFQPIGPNKGIIYKSGFRRSRLYVSGYFFGKDNLFHHKEEMYTMNSNVFSIDSNVVVSEKTSD